MRGLLALALLVAILGSAAAASCSYTRNYSCGGWWSRRTCQQTLYRQCPKVNGGWSQWYEMERAECSVDCGGGTLTVHKARACNNPRPAYGGDYCIGDSQLRESVPCNQQACPIDGGWSGWTNASRSACSQQCGSGSVTVRQARTCTSPAPQHGGRSCPGDSVRDVTEACYIKPCPIDGGWSDWGEWEEVSPCTVKCGGGTHNETRGRTCDNPEPQFGGLECAGAAQETKVPDCNTHSCGSECPEGENTYLAAEDTHYFYHCQQGDDSSTTKAILEKCPKKTEWSQTSQTCVWKAEEIAAAAPTPTPAPACVTGAMRVNPDDCTRYLTCLFGSEVDQPCFSGGVFDSSLGLCNWPAPGETCHTQ